MKPKVVAGAVAGLLAGLVFGVMMQMMTTTTPEGERMPMMGMVAMVVGSQSLVVGWLYHLFNSAVIGALFGWLLGTRVTGYGSGATLGAVWGAVWWVLGGLVLMPLFLGMPALTPVRAAGMRPQAMMSLVGHLVYGVIAGVAYVRLRRGAASAPPTAARTV